MSTHQTIAPIPVLPGRLGGQPTQLIDARRLHEFLGVGRFFANWIKGRIQEYGFEEHVDYVVAQANEFLSPFDSPDPVNQTGGFCQSGQKPQGGRPTCDYFLTLDMAKELAMVERTPRGRQARRYFIECERQLQQLRQRLTAPPVVPARLTRAERQAINRQAWAEAAGDIQATFHARREVLIREYTEATGEACLIYPRGYRPSWAK